MSARQRNLERFASRLAVTMGAECKILAHRRLPSAIHAREITSDLAGIIVSLKATDCYGPCIWTFYFDIVGILRSQARHDGTDLTADVIDPPPNLLDIAASMARDAIRWKM